MKKSEIWTVFETPYKTSVDGIDVCFPEFRPQVECGDEMTY